MTQYRETRKSLHKHNLAPKKKFGQNFLVNKSTAAAIVEAGDVGPEDTIIEVGVGLGALTLPLAERAARVIGIEVDSGIIRFHEQENDLPDNVELIHQDILKCDFNDLQKRYGGPLKIMANLPYSISNPFIFHLIDNRLHVESATIMLQKEVADRLMAGPGTKEYGIPSVLLQSCASISRHFTLKPAEFHPRPKVDSVVISIRFNRAQLLSPDGREYDYSILNRLVRTTFNQRRKTIANTLANAALFTGQRSVDKAENKRLTLQVLSDAGYDPALRPEKLSLEDFIALTLIFEERMGNFPHSSTDA